MSGPQCSASPFLQHVWVPMSWCSKQKLPALVIVRVPISQPNSDCPCVSFSTANVQALVPAALEKIWTTLCHLCHSTVCRSTPTALLLARRKALHQHTAPAGSDPTFHSAPVRVPRHPWAVSSWELHLCQAPAQMLWQLLGPSLVMLHHHPALSRAPGSLLQKLLPLITALCQVVPHLSLTQHPNLPSAPQCSAALSQTPRRANELY